MHLSKGATSVTTHGLVGMRHCAQIQAVLKVKLIGSIQMAHTLKCCCSKQQAAQENVHCASLLERALQMPAALPAGMRCQLQVSWRHHAMETAAEHAPLTWETFVYLCIMVSKTAAQKECEAVCTIGYSHGSALKLVVWICRPNCCLVGMADWAWTEGLQRLQNTHVHYLFRAYASTNCWHTVVHHPEVEVVLFFGESLTSFDLCVVR